MQTIDELIRDAAEDDRVGIGSLRRPDLDPRRGGPRPRPSGPPSWPSLRRPGPFHVALLLDNVPEYVFWMGGAALAGAVVVGGNPTHRGDELARDLSHTECQLLVTNRHLPAPGRGTRPRSGPAGRPHPGRSTTPPATSTRAPRPTGPCWRRWPAAPLPDQDADRGHRGHPRLPAVHLGHLGRPQGLPVQPGPAGPDRRHRGPDVRAHRGRRLLPGHAPLPLQRPDGRVGPGPGRRGHRRPPRTVQRLAVPRRRPPLRRHLLQLRGQAPLLHPGHPGAPRRRRQPAAAGVRQRGGRGRRGPVRRAVRRAPSRTPTAPPRAGRPSSAPRTPRGGRWVGRCPAP